MFQTIHCVYARCEFRCVCVLMTVEMLLGRRWRYAQNSSLFFDTDFIGSSFQPGLGDTSRLAAEVAPWYYNHEWEV